MSMQQKTAAALTGLTLLAATSMAMAADPQGMYSADQLMDADVYASGSDKKIGEVEDILFDNNMAIKSFVVETGGKFGLGGKSYVVAPDQLTVQTTPGKEATKPSYRITLNASGQQLSGYPVYNDTWWNNTQSQAESAWDQTKQSAKSAWTQIKQSTSSIVNGNDNSSTGTVSGQSDTQGTTQQSTDTSTGADTSQGTGTGNNQ